jgi:PKD domain
VWSASATVRINAQPTAAINGNPSNTCIAPCTVNFTATVFGGTAPFNFTWNFGDGSGPGFNQYSLHEYRAVGNFSVSVATVDALGVTAPLAFYPAKIGSPLQVQLVADPSTTTRGSRVTFQGAASGGFGLYAFQWSGLPTPCASQDSPTLVCSPNESGTFVVTLQVTDRYGFHSATSVTFVVRPPNSFDWVPILVTVGLLGTAGIAAAVWLSRRFRRRRAERTSSEKSGLTGPPSAT